MEFYYELPSSYFSKAYDPSGQGTYTPSDINKIIIDYMEEYFSIALASGAITASYGGYFSADKFTIDSKGDIQNLNTSSKKVPIEQLTVGKVSNPVGSPQDSFVWESPINDIDLSLQNKTSLHYKNGASSIDDSSPMVSGYIYADLV